MQNATTQRIVAFCIYPVACLYVPSPQALANASKLRS